VTNGLHADEFRIDGDLVSRLISTQFPQFAALPLRRLDAFGSTNVLFRLGVRRALVHRALVEG